MFLFILPRHKCRGFLYSLCNLRYVSWNFTGKTTSFLIVLLLKNEVSYSSSTTASFPSNRSSLAPSMNPRKRSSLRRYSNFWLCSPRLRNTGSLHRMRKSTMSTPWRSAVTLNWVSIFFFIPFKKERHTEAIASVCRHSVSLTLYVFTSKSLWLCLENHRQVFGTDSRWRSTTHTGQTRHQDQRR